MTPEREKEIRQWIADADHSPPTDDDGRVEPQAPISVRQAEDLLTEIDRLREKYARLVEAAKDVLGWGIEYLAEENTSIAAHEKSKYLKDIDALRNALPEEEK
jgi:ribosome-binding protein aMBF1 (putative translation factor)